MLKKLDFRRRRLKRVLRRKDVPCQLLTLLPMELIEAIGFSVQPADLCSLRLTCKIFYRATIRHFGRTCLRTVETDLSLGSLERLAVIAQHQQLRHHVHHLSMVGTDRLSRRGIKSMVFGQGFSWDRHPSGHLLLSQPQPQPGIQKLQDILTLLTNCSSFYMCGASPPEEFLESDCLEPSDVVTVILNIVVETGLPVRSFSVDFKVPHSSGVYAIDARRLYMPDFQKAGFATAWSHLRELSLQQQLEPDTADWATELIIHAHNLQKLTLNFYFGDAVESVIHRLASADSLFPQLQHLDLNCAMFKREELLLAFLHHFRHSLHTLYLGSVYVNAGGWKPVLTSLSTDFPLLKSIRLMHLHKSGGLPTTVHFPALLDNPFVNRSHGRRFIFSSRRLFGRECVIWVGYTGPEMDTALQTLIGCAENV